MKIFILEKLKSLLVFLAQATVIKYQPSIIGITGSVGKTSTKEAIHAILKDMRSLRVTRGNLNTEFGLPLTILGDWSKEDLAIVSRDSESNKLVKLFFWLKVALFGFKNIIFKIKYPEILLLEYGIQKPGDMKYLLDIAKPSIAIMTALGDVPAHLEFFNSVESLAKEKSRFVEAASAIGFVILNADDKLVYEMKDSVRAHVVTYGFDKDAEVRIINLENLSTEDRPFGVSFKLGYAGAMVPVRFTDTFGKPQAYAAAAAAAVGIIFGSNLVKISESLSKNYVPAKHRMNLIRPEAGFFILDDSYNASPASMYAAIDTVKSLTAKRKIAVLGDMLELGESGIRAHEEIGRVASEVFDFLFTVGVRGKIIAASAIKDGHILKKNIKSFDSVSEVIIELKPLLKPGDLVLIKASRGIGLDHVVDALK